MDAKTHPESVTFREKINRINNIGFKSFELVEYFFFFSENEGKSVRGLANGDMTEYQKSLRFFKLLATGSNREGGLHLFENDLKSIKLTLKGRRLFLYLTDNAEAN